MKKMTNEELLKMEKFHQEVAKKCGPIVDDLIYKQFPDKTPEELGQILIHDNMTGNLMCLFYLSEDEQN